ncbi:MAG TPA: hypothetical protein VLU96_07245 [Gaiellaceae bacterium]|nr:hypothetical protein [Gaiellaceae bacterium]
MSRRAARGLVAAALVVAFAAGFGTDRLLRSEPSTTPAAPTVRAELGPSFSVSPEVVGLVFLGGRLWIKTQGGAAWGNEGQEHTYRLDPAGPHLEGPLGVKVSIFPVGAAGQPYGANTFVPSGKNVWAGYVAAGRRTENAIVKELDRRTGRAIGRSLSVPGVPDKMAVNDGYVWLFTHNEDELGMRLWQIDPRRHALVGSPLRIADAEMEDTAPVATSKQRLWLSSAGKLFEIDLVEQAPSVT